MVAGILATIITILTILEKTQKIKFKPISWIVGNRTNEIKEMIDVLSNKIDDLSDREIQHYKLNAMIAISGFATDLRNSRKDGKLPLEVKSETEFIAISELCKEYLNKNWNTKIRHDAEFIYETYKSIDIN